ncbi:hypothetical protein TNCV_3580571 [Trichonephila clavipes]|nr:hypothetical protein TNCV_3580571 [Trichonephila clavipes]
MDGSRSLYVAVSHKDDMEIIICEKSQFLNLMSTKYNIRRRNIVLFDYETENAHNVISVNDITDGMIVRVVDKSKFTQMTFVDYVRKYGYPRIS